MSFESPTPNATSRYERMDFEQLENDPVAGPILQKHILRFLKQGGSVDAGPQKTALRLNENKNWFSGKYTGQLNEQGLLIDHQGKAEMKPSAHILDADKEAVIAEARTELSEIEAFEAEQVAQTPEGDVRLEPRTIRAWLDQEKGIPVVIRLSSGKIESGWKISGMNDEATLVRVDKDGAEPKLVSLKELQEWKEQAATEVLVSENSPEKGDVSGEQITPDTIREAVANKKPIVVKIKRSSGELVEGWDIVGVLENQTDVRVVKTGAGSKVVSLANINTWNTPEVAPVQKTVEPPANLPVEEVIEQPEERKSMSELLTPEGIGDSLANDKLIEVNVQRSSGSMDTGWKVIGIAKLGRSNQGEVVVEVTKSGVGSKKVPLSMLRQWNPDKEEQEEPNERVFGVPRPTKEELEKEFGE